MQTTISDPVPLRVIRLAGWLVGVPKVAAYSGYSVATCRAAIRSGALLAYRLEEGGTLTCKRDDVDAWVTANGPVVPNPGNINQEEGTPQRV